MQINTTMSHYQKKKIGSTGKDVEKSNPRTLLAGL